MQKSERIRSLYSNKSSNFDYLEHICIFVRKIYDEKKNQQSPCGVEEPERANAFDY
jgi:hypothetical protein